VGYINRSQTNECGNWDCGPAIPFLGIFVSNFRYLFCSAGTQIDEILRESGQEIAVIGVLADYGCFKRQHTNKFFETDAA
jgi:hypothetical protein